MAINSAVSGRSRFIPVTFSAVLKPVSRPLVAIRTSKDRPALYSSPPNHWEAAASTEYLSSRRNCDILQYCSLFNIPCEVFALCYAPLSDQVTSDLPLSCLSGPAAHFKYSQSALIKTYCAEIAGTKRACGFPNAVVHDFIVFSSSSSLLMLTDCMTELKIYKCWFCVCQKCQRIKREKWTNKWRPWTSTTTHQSRPWRVINYIREWQVSAHSLKVVRLLGYSLD